jgi:intracellular septation protein
MKQLLEFIPIALFFIVYQLKGESIAVAGWEYTFDGIFTATAVLMAATVLQVILSYLLSGEIEKRLLWMLLAVLLFGGATLLFRNQMFIQWKPTIFNWALALIFGGSQFIGDKNLMERTLGSQIHLPKPTWLRLNLLWVVNFALVGSLNLYVAYSFSEAAWVSYKLYSAIGFTLALTILTALLISPHLKDQEPDDKALTEDP